MSPASCNIILTIANRSGSLRKTEATNDKPNNDIIAFIELREKTSNATLKADVIVSGSVAIDLSCGLIVPELDPRTS